MEELTQIEGIGPTTAEKLFERGFDSLERLAQADFAEIEDIRGALPQWIEDAAELVLLNDAPFDGDWDDVEPVVEVFEPLEQHVMAGEAPHEHISGELRVFTPVYHDDPRLIALQDALTRKIGRQDVETIIWLLVEGKLKEFGI
jgi:hypothetical protein